MKKRYLAPLVAAHLSTVADPAAASPATVRAGDASSPRQNPNERQVLT